MNIHKKAAIEFCISKYVSNRMLDIWLTIILSLGLAILFFPILIWLIYRYFKAKKKMKDLRNQINHDSNLLEKIHVVPTFNSIVVHINGTSIEIPQLYLWFSKYSKKELVRILNN